MQAPVFDHVIQIKVVGDSLVLSDESLHVRRRQTMTWQSELDTAWAVVFKNQTPFRSFSNGHGGGEPGPPSKVRDQPELEGKRYSYTVAVWTGKKIVLKDPEVVVDPDP